MVQITPGDLSSKIMTALIKGLCYVIPQLLHSVFDTEHKISNLVFLMLY